jgi:hypothetical protein
MGGVVFSQMWENAVVARGGEYGIFFFFSVVSAVFIGVCGFSPHILAGYGISGTPVA